MLATAALYLSLLLSVVLGFPLSERDVINPHITNPRNGTVWSVGAKETVTWDTSDLPPDSQITNPTGTLLLGHLADDGENLDLKHPLAQKFKLRDGNVTITVPDVPDRDDYIVVLMGDSGNASPTFVITSISKGSSSSKSSATVRAVTTSSALITSPIPIIGSQITGSATTEGASTPSASTPETTATAPASSQTPSQGGTAAPASASASAAWSIHDPRLWSIISAPLVLAFLI